MAFPSKNSWTNMMVGPPACGVSQVVKEFEELSNKLPSSLRQLLALEDRRLAGPEKDFHV